MNFPLDFIYGLMTEKLIICEVRMDKAAGRGDSDSRMTSFEVIMPLKFQSTMKILCVTLARLVIRENE